MFQQEQSLFALSSRNRSRESPLQIHRLRVIYPAQMEYLTNWAALLARFHILIVTAAPDIVSAQIYFMPKLLAIVNKYPTNFR
jgi:hypothetical protein